MNILKYAHSKLDYRFNGKELDPETGNYYYGARYYDPKISVWLSVDPLANESPNQTPYHFVSNNPIMRIDPDGLTDYTIDKKTGNITMVPGTETTEGPDRLIMGRARYRNGELRNRHFVEVSKEVTSFVDKGLTGKGNLQYLEFQDQGKARETFEMIAHKVRDIEFGLADFSESDGSNFSLLFTAHDTHNTNLGTDLLEVYLDDNKGRKMDRLTHNHGNPEANQGRVGKFGPSPDDEDQVSHFKRNYPNQTKNTEYYIWKFGTETQYDETGKID